MMKDDKTRVRRNSRSIILIFLLAALFLLVLSSKETLLGGNYPKDGIFKRLPNSNDKWFYVDNNNWEIKAPDKWTHMMGSLGSTTILSRMMNRYAAGALVFCLGLYKEYDDAYREGWSYRDIIADAIGVAGSLFFNHKVQLLADYDSGTVTLKLFITI